MIYIIREKINIPNYFKSKKYNYNNIKIKLNNIKLLQETALLWKHKTRDYAGHGEGYDETLEVTV